VRLLLEALVCLDNADVAQLVEHNLAKVGVAGSNPVVRSRNRRSGAFFGGRLLASGPIHRSLIARSGWTGKCAVPVHA
jgi:hypothetical protein